MATVQADAVLEFDVKRKRLWGMWSSRPSERTVRSWARRRGLAIAGPWDPRVNDLGEWAWRRPMRWLEPSDLHPVEAMDSATVVGRWLWVPARLQRHRSRSARVRWVLPRDEDRPGWFVRWPWWIYEAAVVLNHLEGRVRPRTRKGDVLGPAVDDYAWERLPILGADDV